MVFICIGDTTAGEEELEDEEEDEEEERGDSAAGSTATPTPAPSEPETTETRPGSSEEVSQPKPTASSAANKESLLVGTKRKAEVLSKESGKIGVTITTSAHSSHHHHHHHSHKQPRLSSPPHSPAATHLPPVVSVNLGVSRFLEAKIIINISL